MAVDVRTDDTRTLKNKGVKSLFDTEVNIKIRVLTILAIAGSLGNTLGFIANYFLYGFNFVTGFCALCAILLILILFFGLQSKYGIVLGYAMLFLLNVLEFPLLTLTYGAVMYPYMIIGFHALVMVCEKSRRIYLAVILGIYDLLVIVYSSIHPYIFGPQDSVGLLGSAVITFAISILTVASLVIMWQNVYLVDTIEIDSITRLQSRTGFIKNAQKIIQNESSTEYLLLYFDVFSFKVINSVYGIEGGNRFLASVADSLTKNCFSPRLLGRLNADKFVCLLSKKNFNLDELNNVCQIPFEENGRKIVAQLHCGIYEIKDVNLPISEMIDKARTAIRFVYTSGQKYYAFYDDQAEQTYQEETVVLAEIDKAINEGQFYPYYQPIVDCKTQEIVSAEALARWIHPELGMIKPKVFIPILEKKNLISNLDYLMATRVSEFIQSRLEKNENIIPISLNISRDDLYDEKVIKEIEALVEKVSKGGYKPRIEITESVYDEVSERMLGILSDFRIKGAHILVDDFGQGYSSLGMITDYEFDIIKLDIQFASKISENEKIVGVIQSIIDMSHKLGAKVIAEGVETETQLKVLRECGCDYAQGFYFYQPLSEEEFAKLLK